MNKCMQIRTRATVCLCPSMGIAQIRTVSGFVSKSVTTDLGCGGGYNRFWLLGGVPAKCNMSYSK